MTNDFRIDKNKTIGNPSNITFYGVNTHKPKYIPASVNHDSIPPHKSQPPAVEENNAKFKIVKPLLEDKPLLPEEVFAKCTKPEEN
jgi:hypothetical protein